MGIKSYYAKKLILVGVRIWGQSRLNMGPISWSLSRNPIFQLFKKMEGKAVHYFLIIT